MTRRQHSLRRFLATDENIPNVAFRSIVTDSRGAAPGCLFVAPPGLHARRLDAYTRQAVAAGAAAIISASKLELPVPTVVLPDLEQRLPALYARHYQTCSLPFPVIGITGTNGKTSTAWQCASLLYHQRYKVGFLGTLGNGIFDPHGSQLRPSRLTTLDNHSLHRTVCELRAQSITALVMEVSSHGIDQRRIAQIPFHTGVLTNIGRDHLDYHPDIEHYRNTKRAFFTVFRPRHWIINSDAPGVQDLAHAAQARSFGTNRQAHWRISHVKKTCDGICFRLNTRKWQQHIAAPVTGLFQSYNLSAALMSVDGLGTSVEHSVQALPALTPVRGRMEAVGRNAQVIIDFAHTPDALEAALQSLRPAPAALWCVFGCGGDRDQGKRRLMGEVASRHCDHVIITDDNPRNETASRIRGHIKAGAPKAVEIGDRAQAIRYALKHAGEKDIVLIAGKGHEPFQIVGTEKIPFSDRSCALAILRERSNNKSAQ